MLTEPSRAANGDAQCSMTLALAPADAAEDSLLNTYSALGSAGSEALNVARIDRMFTTPAPALPLTGTESTGPQGTSLTTYSHAAAAARLRERHELKEIEAMKLEVAKIQRDNLIMQRENLMMQSGSADLSGGGKALGRSRQASTSLLLLLNTVIVQR